MMGYYYKYLKVEIVMVKKKVSKRQLSSFPYLKKSCRNSTEAHKLQLAKVEKNLNGGVKRNANIWHPIKIRCNRVIIDANNPHAKQVVKRCVYQHSRHFLLSVSISLRPNH
jgi:hypothetical protein